MDKIKSLRIKYKAKIPSEEEREYRRKFGKDNQNIRNLASRIWELGLRRDDSSIQEDARTGMQMLADALEESGYTDKRILTKLRSPKVRVTEQIWRLLLDLMNEF